MREIIFLLLEIISVNNGMSSKLWKTFIILSCFKVFSFSLMLALF